MGQRSANTTKSGKYLTPANKVRKEARRKELKKNKKQRQLVRLTILKSKDLDRIFGEMEKIDDMEYNVLAPAPLSKKVLRDKRNKLKETLDRVMNLYDKDELKQSAEIKQKELEYEKKRHKKQQYYESVKYAQTVKIDEIPLPFTSPPTTFELHCAEPLPHTMHYLQTIASDQLAKVAARNFRNACLPELPPGTSPNLSETSVLDTDNENNIVAARNNIPKISTKNELLPSSESEELADKIIININNITSNNAKNDNSDNTDNNANELQTASIYTALNDKNVCEDSLSNEMPQIMLPIHPAQTLFLAPAATLSTHHVPLIMPYDRQLHFMSPEAFEIPLMSSLLDATGEVLPNLYMNLPMRAIHPLVPNLSQYPEHQVPSASETNSKCYQNQLSKATDKKVSTIKAKPCMRDMTADVTRFIPTSLLVKRKDTKSPNKIKPKPNDRKMECESTNANGANADDLYLEFMNEIKELI